MSIEVFNQKRKRKVKSTKLIRWMPMKYICNIDIGLLMWLSISWLSPVVLSFLSPEWVNLFSMTILDNCVNNLVEKLQASDEKQELITVLKQLRSLFFLPDPRVTWELLKCLYSIRPIIKQMLCYELVLIPMGFVCSLMSMLPCYWRYCFRYTSSSHP